jgi:hypothetical protein
MQGEPFSTSVVVRVTVAEDGVVAGVIERPRTGEKHRFEGVEALAVLVAQIARKAAQVALVIAVLTTAAVDPVVRSTGPRCQQAISADERVGDHRDFQARFGDGGCAPLEAIALERDEQSARIVRGAVRRLS